MRLDRCAILLAALILPVLPRAAAAQGDDRWQLTLEGDSVLWDVRLVRLDGDTVRVRRGDSLYAAPVERLREIRLFRKSEMQLGAGAVAGAGNALTGADDEVFDLSLMDFVQKLRAVQRILLMHPPTGP